MICHELTKTRNQEERLFNAIKKGDYSTVEDLLSSDVCPRIYFNGETPLHVACLKDNVKIVRLLLMKGAKVLSRDFKGNTPLHIACDNGCFKVVKILLKATSFCDTRNIQGCTPLHVACSKGNIYIMKTLLRAGADREAVDFHGQTPLHIACKVPEEKNALAINLLRLGTDFEARDNLGNTPLHIACKYRNSYLMSLLLDMGADINAKNVNGLLPFQNACRGLTFPFEEIKCLRTLNTMESFIIKHMTLNKHIDSEVYTSLDSFYEILDTGDSLYNEGFFEECEKEVKILKETSIRPGINFYKFLHTDINKITVWLKDENVYAYLKGLDFKTLFPIFCELIRFTFTRAVERKNLIQDAIPYFFNIFKTHSFGCLPLECVELILLYLSNRDLKILSENTTAPKEMTYYI